MNISADFLIAILLLSLRLSAFFILLPIVAINELPRQIKIITVLSLSTLLVISCQQTISPSHLLMKSLIELANGVVFALAIHTSFAAFNLTGQLIENQMGLNATAIFNPATKNNTSIIGTLFSLLATFLFFSFDGHVLLFTSLVQSIVLFPIGSHLFAPTPLMFIHQFGLIFVFALTIASPVVFSLLLIDITSALITRNMPQINLFFIILPIKIMSGLIILAYSMQKMSPFLHACVKYIGHYWQGVVTQ